MLPLRIQNHMSCGQCDQIFYIFTSLNNKLKKLHSCDINTDCYINKFCQIDMRSKRALLMLCCKNSKSDIFRTIKCIESKCDNGGIRQRIEITKNISIKAVLLKSDRGPKDFWTAPSLYFWWFGIY